MYEDEDEYEVCEYCGYLDCDCYHDGYEEDESVFEEEYENECFAQDGDEHNIDYFDDCFD